MKKLSILIPSVESRRNTFLPKIQDEIYKQISEMDQFEQTMVEVIVLSDNKSLTLGDKRNLMVEISTAKYVQFVDDDDSVSPDFIKSLLDATDENTDVISFNAEVSINGGDAKICSYSIGHKRDYNTAAGYFRIPNHISCVKRELALKSSFPSLKYAEDVAYAKLLLPHLKSEHRINRTLYYYKYDDNVTETQYQNMPEHIRKRRQDPAVADIVILSKSDTPALRAMTQRTVDTLLSGANQLPVNIFVVEQIANVTYHNAITVYHNAPFNYNQFCNLGARQGSSDWIVFANNDLIAQHGWLHGLMTADNDLVSPHEPKDPRQRDISENTKGSTNGKHFSGWIFGMKRDLWVKIGGLDEDFPFWFADDSVIQQCIKVGVTPMVVKNSIVHHLGSTTFKQLSQEKQEEYTWGLTDKFNKKYNQNKFESNPYFQDFLKRTKK